MLAELRKIAAACCGNDEGVALARWTIHDLRRAARSLMSRAGFDRYSGTYPNAANIPGEQSWVGIFASVFDARGNMPKVDGLTGSGRSGPSTRRQQPSAPRRSRALEAGNLPAVSCIKPPHYANGHPGYSDPLVSQADLVQTINDIMMTSEWESTAIILNWADSDGWYDHVYPPVLQPSNPALDFYCSNGQPAPGDSYSRCGLAPRMPFLVISPWAKHKYVDHTGIDWGSLLLFIEQHWGLGFIDGPVAPPLGTGSFDRYSSSMEGSTSVMNPISARLFPSGALS
jgi:hypothetical protein